jgi:hypothetical protein
MLETITLSESAVAVLRFRVKGFKVPVREHSRPAFQELVDAGIMEPDGEDFQFTHEGWISRVGILSEAEDRIERNRHEPPAAILSEEAKGFLRRVVSGDRPEITPESLPLLRELNAARVIHLGSSFAGGTESVYRFTYWGWHKRFELAGMACAKGAV